MKMNYCLTWKITCISYEDAEKLEKDLKKLEEDFWVEKVVRKVDKVKFSVRGPYYTKAFRVLKKHHDNIILVYFMGIEAIVDDGGL